MAGRQVYDHDIDLNQDPYTHMMHTVFCRWKPYILHGLFFDEKSGKGSYFSHILKQIPISPKVLAENLKDLEEDGLIVRQVLDTRPPRTCYVLTDMGRNIIGLLDQVYRAGHIDMTRKNLLIDPLGEMWHGYREPDEDLMQNPFKPSRKPPKDDY